MRRNFCLVVVTGAVLGLLMVHAALANGGASIASAPALVFGQQEFGNTATDGPQASSDRCTSWWTLPALAGDQITVDWKATGPQQDGQYAASQAFVYPPGTNDYNLVTGSGTVVHAFDDNDTGYGHLQFAAQSTGSYPLEFYDYYCQNAGPYEVTAYVTHAVVLTVSIRSIRSSHTTRVSVSAFHASGDPITDPALTAVLQQPRKPRGWTTIQTASRQPFTLSKRWPRRLSHTHQTLRIVVSGPSYQTVTRQIRVNVRATF